MMILIERKGDDGLTCQEWQFTYLQGLRFVLGHYYTYDRQTKRHKWIVRTRYNRISKRDSNIEMQDVPMPDDVIAEWKQRAIDSLQLQLT